jgi:hypothetical protein
LAEFGFMMGLSPREPISRFGDLARQAEELGFEPPLRPFADESGAPRRRTTSGATSPAAEATGRP